MTIYTTPLSLAEALISQPSYVDDTSDESPALAFLIDYITTTFPEMKLEKQYLKNSLRYNLILRGKK